jgi:hypothetical protein
MSQLDDLTHGRTDFLEALKLLALAGARLPFGMSEPALSGTAAVELYTGGLWSAPNLEVVASDARPLTAELFAVGFRWCERPLRTGRGLWHPGGQIGIDIVEAGNVPGVAEPSNRLRLEIDRDPLEPTDILSLAVIGIEDLIVQRAGCWRRDGGPYGEQGAILQALLGLGQDGVGGPFDIDYLQRRLAYETKGEVVIETQWFEVARHQIGVSRTIGLIAMQARIRAWRVRHGLSSGSSQTTDPDRSCGGVFRPFRMRSGAPGWNGRSGLSSRQIVSFDTAF